MYLAYNQFSRFQTSRLIFMNGLQTIVVQFFDISSWNMDEDTWNTLISRIGLHELKHKHLI